MSLYYILDENNNPVQCDLFTYCEWSSKSFRKRIVQQDSLPGGIRVSTVFLCLNHAFGDNEPPILFETMIFGGENDGYQERYCTWDEAKEGHQKAIELVFS
jgi:hypothetical protein